MIDAALRAAVEDLLGAKVGRAEAARGGCINEAAILHLADGRTAFAKWNASSPPGMFAAEARGLELLRRAGGVRVPEVFGAGTVSDGTSFLLMENVTAPRMSQRHAGNFDEVLGRGLADIHRSHAERFGLEWDNTIGPTPQVNTPADDWAEFFAERRIRPLVRLLHDSGVVDRAFVARAERFCGRLPSLLPPSGEPPSLLHGDLWGGNVLRGGDGTPVLIDPAVYYGDREADLAMTELFGGFSAAFRAAYEEAWPLREGYRERRDLMNLYHILNHYLLFGGGYGSQAARIIERHAG